MLDNYIARMLGTKRSKPAQVSAFDRLVRPEIGTRSIYDLRRADIAGLLDKIEDSAGPVAGGSDVGLYPRGISLAGRP